MIESIGATIHVACFGPDCWQQDPHAHQHFVYWPDDDELT